jgi:hypothetical protein
MSRKNTTNFHSEARLKLIGIFDTQTHHLVTQNPTAEIESRQDME